MKRNSVGEKVPIVTVTIDSSDEENDVEVDDTTETNSIGNCCSLEFVKSQLEPQGPVQSSSSSSNKTKKTIVTIDLTDGDEEIGGAECSSDLNETMHLSTTAVSPASEPEQVSDENLARSSQSNAFILSPPPSFADICAAVIAESEISDSASKVVEDQQENQVFYTSSDCDPLIEHIPFSPSTPTHGPPTVTQDGSLSSPESINFGAVDNTWVKPESQINQKKEIDNDIITGDGQFPTTVQTAIAGTSQNSSYSSLVTTTQKRTIRRTDSKTQEQLGPKSHSMALRKTRHPSKKLQNYQHQHQLQPSSDKTVLVNNSTRRKNKITEKPKVSRSGSPLSDNITRMPASEGGYYRCNFCGKGFTVVTHAKYHVRVHTGSKEFKCQQCHKEFAYKYYLKQHENIHSKTKPFQCQFCQNKYYYQASKSLHEKTCRMKSKLKP